MNISKIISDNLFLKSNSKCASTNKSANVYVDLSGNNYKTFFQLCKFPVSLNPSNYSNPLSGSNPKGDIRSLFAIKEFIDPVPIFDTYYSPSSISTDMLYSSILESISTKSVSNFSNAIISDAKKLYTNNSLANLDGTVGSWHPIYSMPNDWATASVSRYSKLSIDFENSFTTNTGPDILLDNHTLLINTIKGNVKQLHPDSKIKSLKMNYLYVEFTRPWFNFTLFNISDWYLQSYKTGFISSGSESNNDGIFPLLPTSMIIAKDVELQIDFSDEDKIVINDLKSTNQDIYVGPFNILNNDEALFIIGWISSIIPISPPTSS